MFCTQCGVENDDAAKFCINCGASLGDKHIQMPSLWNPYAANCWSILFSPAFGAYLNALNWKAMGDEGKARASMIWFYVSAALLVPDLFVPPDARQAVNLLYVVYLLVWYFVSGRPQEKYVKRIYDKAYPRKLWGKPLGIAFLALVVYTLVGVGVAFRLVSAP